MREHEENWLKQLDTVTIEIAGLHEIFEGPQFLQILCKLEGLKIQKTEFELYRKTVFECIRLLQELNRGIRLLFKQSNPFQIIERPIGSL